MHEGIGGFKTALVGGFCREDVLRYIEKAAQEARQQQEALQVERNQAVLENDALSAENIALKEKNAELLERMGELTLDAERMREEMVKSRAKSQSDIASLQLAQERIRKLEERDAVLTERVAALSATVEQYNLDKKYLAEMELEAMHRIELQQKQAQEDVEKTRSQAVLLIDATKQAMQKISLRWRDSSNAFAAAAAEHGQMANELLHRMDETTQLLEQMVVGKTAGSDAEDRPTMQDVLGMMQEDATGAAINIRRT